MCIAVLVMLLWHLWGVAGGETSVEAQDHAVYRKVAKDRGEVCLFLLLRCTRTLSELIALQTFVNSYDLGYVDHIILDFVSTTKNQQQSTQESCPFLQYRAKWIVRHAFVDRFSFTRLTTLKSVIHTFPSF